MALLSAENAWGPRRRAVLEPAAAPVRRATLLAAGPGAAPAARLVSMADAASRKASGGTGGSAPLHLAARPKQPDASQRAQLVPAHVRDDTRRVSLSGAAHVKGSRTGWRAIVAPDVKTPHARDVKAIEDPRTEGELEVKGTDDDALSFWRDAGPQLRAGQKQVLLVPRPAAEERRQRKDAEEAVAAASRKVLAGGTGRASSSKATPRGSTGPAVRAKRATSADFDAKLEGPLGGTAFKVKAGSGDSMENPRGRQRAVVTAGAHSKRPAVAEEAGEEPKFDRPRTAVVQAASHARPKPDRSRPLTRVRGLHSSAAWQDANQSSNEEILSVRRREDVEAVLTHRRPGSDAQRVGVPQEHVPLARAHSRPAADCGSKVEKPRRGGHMADDFERRGTVNRERATPKTLSGRPPVVAKEVNACNRVQVQQRKGTSSQRLRAKEEHPEYNVENEVLDACNLADDQMEAKDEEDADEAPCEFDGEGLCEDEDFEEEEVEEEWCVEEEEEEEEEEAEEEQDDQGNEELEEEPEEEEEELEHEDFIDADPRRRGKVPQVRPRSSAVKEELMVHKGKDYARPERRAVKHEHERHHNLHENFDRKQVLLAPRERQSHGQAALPRSSNGQGGQDEREHTRSRPMAPDAGEDRVRRRCEEDPLSALRPTKRGKLEEGVGSMKQELDVVGRRRRGHEIHDSWSRAGAAPRERGALPDRQEEDPASGKRAKRRAAGQPPGLEEEEPVPRERGRHLRTDQPSAQGAEAAAPRPEARRRRGSQEEPPTAEAQRRPRRAPEVAAEPRRQVARKEARSRPDVEEVDPDLREPLKRRKRRRLSEVEPELDSAPGGREQPAEEDTSRGPRECQDAGHWEMVSKSSPSLDAARRAERQRVGRSGIQQARKHKSRVPVQPEASHRRREHRTREKCKRSQDSRPASPRARRGAAQEDAQDRRARTRHSEREDRSKALPRSKPQRARVAEDGQQEVAQRATIERDRKDTTSHTRTGTSGHAHRLHASEAIRASTKERRR